MQNFIVALLLAVVLAACGGGGGGGIGKFVGDDSPPVDNPPDPPDPPETSASEQLAEDLDGLAIDEFYEESFKALMYRSPETIVHNALTNVYPLETVGLNDLSDDYRRETFAMYQVVLDGLRAYDRNSISADEQLTYDFYEWFLQDEVDGLPFIYHDFLGSYNFNGVRRGTEQFFASGHPLATRQDAEDYVTRLGEMRRKFQDVVGYLNNQQGAGIVEPSTTLSYAIFLLGAVADGPIENSVYYTSFESGLNDIPDLSDDDREQLLSTARTAIQNEVVPAYQWLRENLQDQQSIAPDEIGVGQYPSGTAYYDYKLKHHTTTDLTAAEIHQLGLDELDRIHAEMRTLFDELGYPQDETLAELFARVETDGGIIPAADVKSTYEDIVAATELVLDEAFDIFPSANVVVADDPFGGFYIGPSFDGSRPGAFYAGTENDEAWFRMPSLAYHEAIPGHHTQIAIAMDQEGRSFRRIVRFTGFVEGWALYAERLAFELGWYEGDIYGNLGRLQYEALRAVRLVVDTGIHSMDWSWDQSVQYVMENLGESQGRAEGAVGRYSVVPGQATAYMTGMLHILSLRQKAADELGSKFDIKDFHRVVLSSGGIPLALLSSVVDRYIADTLAAE